MSWVFTSSADCIRKAGANANSTIIASGAALQDWSDKAEGWIEAETRRKWVDNYSGLDTGIKRVLNDICSSKVAMQIINYDMSGYTSRQEAGTMLDVHDSIVQQGLNFLKDFKSNNLQTP